MLEEEARVVQVENGEVWVETGRQSACASCGASKGCGTAALSKALGQRRNRVRVLSELPLQVGDRVVIGIRERALVRGSLAVYAVPILMLLAGGLVGELGARQFLWDNSELASMVLGLAGLGGGLWWLKRFTRRIRNDRDFQPVVLRRLAVTGFITTG
ncbi:MAG TPA: Fis family transcriptional regulator [Gammaproteobacteria bacterium]|nr:Fis family transcriptional regulator [Gammaproteobacteria bacterium]